MTGDHDAEVVFQADFMGWRSHCSTCGWKGHPRIAKATAREDAEAHNAGEEAA